MRRGWAGPLERWLEARLAVALQPHVQRWFAAWLREPAGRQVIAEAIADVAVEATRSGAGHSGLLEDLVVALVRRLGAADPAVRQRLRQVLDEL